MQKNKRAYLKIYALLFLLCMSICACKKKQDRYLVVSKVKRVSKLATTQTQIDKIVLGTQERKLLRIIHINTARFVAYSQATITAGIDLSELRPEDVRILDERIEINLPHVRVVNFSYPFNAFKIDSNITDNAFLNKIDIDDQEYFYEQAEIDIRNNLQYTGIRTATEEKTRVLMINLLRNLGYEEIYITFKKGPFIVEINPAPSDSLNNN